MKLKILTWNIRHGGTKKKVEDIIGSLILHNADVIVLTEFRLNDNGIKIKSFLNDNGWLYQINTNPPENENGVLIASKFAINVHSVCNYVLPKAEHRWNEVFIKECNIAILGVHIPGVKDKWDKKDYWEAIIQYAKVNMNERCVIIGDFNTGLKDDCEGKLFYLSEYMEELINLGWVDSWRVFNTLVNDYTWYSNVKNGFRLDYAYLSPKIADQLLVSYHSHRERINRYSDHSILITQIVV